MKIYLLDLNYTLVSNSLEKRSPFCAQIAAEQYDKALLEKLDGERVFILTARPDQHKAATLTSLMEKTGWAPERAYFNRYRLPPPLAKRRMLDEILPDFPGATFFAIESNPQTRTMYAAAGIRSCSKERFNADPG